MSERLKKTIIFIFGMLVMLGLITTRQSDSLQEAIDTIYNELTQIVGGSGNIVE